MERAVVTARVIGVPHEGLAVWVATDDPEARRSPGPSAARQAAGAGTGRSPPCSNQVVHASSNQVLSWSSGWKSARW